ncbi:NAD(P)/FAD-dependent oxidoreductase [Corticibacter populi]|uniref:NAD(P)/FAD-dependent oxidoreductase n=1 Tax=Corticibacter populi TaxID=1550736 RepID=A0A3M6QPI9_9BURK|nr:NAD(P)/FAD-dependent oxidoreductase [Corticibacter populi]RMX04973.1 NAD(P)/FAD-dependent oxidoreductase [Corticibacter populi]RZS33598.1 cation diffusion facilitator CzcD-associated flavoprotein CzcO [Corticibacter populi]
MPEETPVGLADLERRLAHDLACLNWPAGQWLPERRHDGQPLEPVVIIGAGQAGLALAFGLRQAGIDPLLLDRAPAGSEGPWATTARMETLRSPKELTGPAMGVPNLTFRAWFEAQFGATGWARLDKIPRLQWMDYLRWYRQVTRPRVRNETAVTRILPHADHVELRLASAAGTAGTTGATGATTLLARHVILATGRDGLGGPAIPAFMRGVDRRLWAHSSDPFDYRSLRGRHVGVIGAGSSAMDSAGTALEEGAASVDLLIRRAEIPRINKSKGSGVPGLTHGHADLPDAWKWRIRHYINRQQVPPPHGSTLRVSRHANAFFHTGCAIERVTATGDAAAPLLVDTTQGRFHFDFLFVATGFVPDWSQRPEFAAFASQVKLWPQRYQLPEAADDAELNGMPDLGPAFEFQEAQPGACPGLWRLHAFCYPAALSFGTISGDIPAISDGARLLATRLASAFYREDLEYHWEKLQAYAEPELDGSEWTRANTPTRIQALREAHAPAAPQTLPDYKQ